MHFESKRITKGIVYYADRLKELEANPDISIHSPFKKPKLAADAAGGAAASVEVEVQVAVSGTLQGDFAAEGHVVGEAQQNPSVTTTVVKKEKITAARKGAEPKTNQVAVERKRKR